MGVHRPALAHEQPRGQGRARGQRHPAATRACADRHDLVARRAVELRHLAAAADGGPRRALALRRRGVPRDQSLPAAAPRAAGSRPAPLHPTHDARRRPRRPAVVGGRRLRHADRHVAGHAVGVPVGLVARRQRLDRGRRRDPAHDARGRAGPRHRPGRGRARSAQPPRRPPASRFRDHLAGRGTGIAAPERGDRRSAGRRRSATHADDHRCRQPRRPQHAGDARGAASKEAGAEGRGRDAGRARHDRDRRAAVPEHPDGRRDSGDGSRLVRAPADAGAARRRLRARLLRDRRASGAPPDRPHGLVRDGLRLGRPRRRRPAREGDQARRAGRRGLSRHRPARVPDGAHRVRKIPRALLQERERGIEEGRLARRPGRAARDDGDPVHDRAAQDAQRRAGAGRRARVPVPGVGRRAGHGGRQVGQAPRRPRR